MRLAAQMRGGFYPAPSEAVAFAAAFLRPPVNEPFSILDPCAGDGAAISQSLTSGRLALPAWYACSAVAKIASSKTIGRRNRLLKAPYGFSFAR